MRVLSTTETGHKLKPCAIGTVSLFKFGKPNPKYVHREVLLAFVPMPDCEEEDWTCDHIDLNHLNNNIDNLRWATKKQQRANQNRPSINQSQKHIEVTIDGSTNICGSIRDVLKLFDIPYSRSQYKFVYDAMKKGTLFRGATLSMCSPPNVGEWHEVPKEFIGGNSGIMASEFGGFIKRPNGNVTTGCPLRDGRRSVGIGGNKYYTYRLTCAAFHGMPSTGKPDVNHKKGNLTECANAADLEWVSAKENNQHASETGLTKIRKAVNMIDKETNQVLATFCSMTKAKVYLLSNEKTKATSCSHIQECCTGLRQSAHGYKWSYADENVGNKRSHVVDESENASSKRSHV